MAKKRRYVPATRDLFTDNEPVPLHRLRAKLGAGGERTDGPDAESAAGSSSERDVTGEAPVRSILQCLEDVACMGPLWQIAEWLDNLYAATRTPGGRSREYNAMDVLLLNCAVPEFRSQRSAAANLADTHTWERLAHEVRAAWPDHPRRRLSQTPPSRSKFQRFQKWLFKAALDGTLRSAARDICLRGGIEIGLIDPKKGSFSHPDKSQFVFGDATWIPGMFHNNDPEAVNPATGNTRRVDPDAVDYYLKDGTLATSPGHFVTLLISRADGRQLRIVFDIDVWDHDSPKKRNESRIAAESLLDMIADNPDQTEGIHGLGFDMALDSVTKDLLLDHALHPVAKPPLDSTGKPYSAVISCPPFRQPGGEEDIPIEVLTADGTPAIIRIDGDGIEQLVPLRRIRTKPIKRPDGHFDVYAEWKIPEHDLIPEHLAGAITSIRHNSTLEERQAVPHTRRTKSLSTIPVTDGDFQRIWPFAFCWDEGGLRVRL